MKQTLGTIHSKIEENDLVLLLFLGNQCNVGEQINLKIEELAVKYPNLKLISSYETEVSSQFQVFAFPAIKLYVQTRLSYEKARVFSIQEFEQKIKRYNQLIQK